MNSLRRFPVMQLSDLPENSNKAVSVDGCSVLVCRTEKGVFAVENRCSHMMAKLEGGRVRGVHLFCPKHGARFDLGTGVPAALAKTPIRTYPVTVSDGMIEVEVTT